MRLYGKPIGIVALGALLVAVLLTGCEGRDKDDALFEEVSYRSGIDYRGMTHGAAWGDVDGDSLPDLYVTNHLNAARLYHNLGNGRFEDVSSRYFAPTDLGGDKHGAAWADFDNDGDQDLIQLTGAKVGVGYEPKKLFLNEGGRLRDVAKERGVDNPAGRTRTPLWFDADGNGQLDLFQGAEARFDSRVPPFWFLQHDGRFDASTDLVPEQQRSTPFCIVTELSGDVRADLLCRVYAPKHAYQLFSTARQPFESLHLLPNTAYWDAASGDFDGDQDLDLYLARRTPAKALVVARPSDTELLANLTPRKDLAGKPFGLRFRTDGPVTIEVSTAHSYKPFLAEQIDIGATSSHPAGLAFRLEPASVGPLTGLGTSDDTRLQIGHQAPDLWTVRLVSYPAKTPTREGHLKFDDLSLRITAARVIEDLESFGAPLSDTTAPDRLFINEGGKLIEEGNDRGIDKQVAASASVVTADFDNDMDLDLYIVTGDEVGNPKNLLLLNRGDGTFDVAEGAGGAPGSGRGVGEAALTADYDRDGFMDLLLVNGGSMGPSLGLAADEGGYQLYHNRGNRNHWLEIALEGRESNHDGIGSTVYVTSGAVTQVRLQDGGIHHRAQNDQVLHFGLGGNKRVDKVEVHWPSGKVQVLEGVEADQLLKVQEPQTK